MENENEPPPPGLEERRRLRLSGKAAACGLVLAFVITAVMIPAVVRLPIWIDFQIVLAAWWAIWLTVLSVMLYHGQRVTDDHQLPEPRRWFNWGDKKKTNETATASSGWGHGWYWGGPADAEGCFWILAALVAVIVLVFAMWFLIEVAIPLVLFVLYLVARGMLSNVINDRHRCTGRLGRSLAWGLIWATAYTAPLAVVVWWVHYVMGRGDNGP